MTRAESSPQALRPVMSETQRFATMADIQAGRPLAHPEQLNSLAARLADPTLLDPWEVTLQFTNALGDHYQLLWSDQGLQRPSLGVEHASVVLGGLESDYTPLLRADGAHEALFVARFAALFQDSGKGLSVVETGGNSDQSRYNKLVTQNALASLEAPEYIKQGIYLLATQDIIGQMLQGRDVTADLTALKSAWPKELAGHFDDLMTMLYLSDASAHSSYRTYQNTRTGWLDTAVGPDDNQLTSLFVRHPSGALTLTPDRCALVAELFPNTRAVRRLIVPEEFQDEAVYPTVAEVFSEVVRQKLRGMPVASAPADYRRPVYGRPTTALADHSDAGRITFTGHPLTRLAEGRLSGPVANVPGYEGMVQTTYHVRNGELTRRTLVYGESDTDPYTSMDYHRPSPPSGKTHNDPYVTASLARLANGRIQEFDLGKPIATEQGAWQVVHWLQSSQIVPPSRFDSAT